MDLKNLKLLPRGLYRKLKPNEVKVGDLLGDSSYFRGGSNPPDWWVYEVTTVFDPSRFEVKLVKACNDPDHYMLGNMSTGHYNYYFKLNINENHGHNHPLTDQFTRK